MHSVSMLLAWDKSNFIEPQSSALTGAVRSWVWSEMKISTSRSETMVLRKGLNAFSRFGMRCCLRWRSLSISGGLLQMGEEWSPRLTGVVSEVMLILDQSVVIKRELSLMARLFLLAGINSDPYLWSLSVHCERKNEITDMSSWNSQRLKSRQLGFFLKMFPFPSRRLC